jgi:hypothetical protein
MKAHEWLVNAFYHLIDKIFLAFCECLQEYIHALTYKKIIGTIAIELPKLQQHN